MAEIIEIKDLADNRLDCYARLTENQLVNRQDPDNGMFIAESPKVVERALNAGYEPVSMLLEKKHIEGEAKDIIARCGDIPIFTAGLDVLSQITGFKLTRGVLCAMKRKKLPSEEELIKKAERIVILEDVVNPTNVGAIFRSAAALGMDAVLLTNNCSDPFYRRADRVSMGTVFQIPWAYVSNWPQSTISNLKNNGFTVMAMALNQDAVSLDSDKIKGIKKVAIVLGTEGEGLSKSTIAMCDYSVIIPMYNGVDSLNVAAASAVAFWQLGKCAED